ncbi:hypothetical protein IMZ48_47785, partial [Candidatus Bathyarchaeota archaeon]|nr:hypothetical protein [Candidatus Bathyarchaeota archaeon]
MKNGSNALAVHQDDTEHSSSHRGTKRKRPSYNAGTSETGSDEEEKSQSDSEVNDLPRSRPVRRTRLVRQQPSNLSDWVLRGADNTERKRPTRALRPRLTSLVPQNQDEDDDIDELAQNPPPESSDEDDNNFDLIRSDLTAAPKRSKGKVRKRSKRLKQKTTGRRAQSRGSSIEFENPRRSGRATRNVTSMTDPVDVDSFYVSDHEAPGAPRVAAVKEVFKPLPEDSDFVKFHMSVCGVCSRGQSPSRGMLVHCQGCTMTYHKMCIGVRAVREHLVTKVDADDFVIQCRFCIGRARAKDKSAARQAMCQACRKYGSACAPFSQRKTPKQEEAARQANEGVDPVTPVPPRLVNNADNVLFRCAGCRRPWHIEHLPKPATREAESDLANVKDERFNEYSSNFMCQECSSMDTKIHTLVAWRPTETAPASSGDLYWSDFAEDDKEYLVKWEGRAYSHCTWMPGAWVFGVASGAMRSSFGKRDAQKGLM